METNTNQKCSSPSATEYVSFIRRVSPYAMLSVIFDDKIGQFISSEKF